MIRTNASHFTRHHWHLVKRELGQLIERASERAVCGDPFGASLLVYVCQRSGYRSSTIGLLGREIIHWVEEALKRPENEWSDREVSAIGFVKAFLPDLWKQCNVAVTRDAGKRLTGLVSPSGNVYERPLCSAMVWVATKDEAVPDNTQSIERYLTGQTEDLSTLLGSRSRPMALGFLAEAGVSWSKQFVVRHAESVMEKLEGSIISVRRRLPIIYMLATVRQQLNGTLRKRLRLLAEEALPSFLAEETGEVSDEELRSVYGKPRSDKSRIDLSLAYAVASGVTPDMITASADELECPIAVRVMAIFTGVFLLGVAAWILWAAYNWQWLLTIDRTMLAGHTAAEQIGHISRALGQNVAVVSVASIVAIAAMTVLWSTAVRGRTHQKLLLRDFVKNVGRWVIPLVVAVVAAVFLSLR